jgi:hypothetical protein
MSLLRTIGIVFFIVAVCYAQSDVEPLRFSAEGFSIKALPSGESNASGQRAVCAFFLPPSAGFAPNINILIQPPVPIEDFAKLSKQQFDMFGFKVIKDAMVPPNEWNVEYEGNTQGRSCHFFARAVRTDKKVFLITATTTADQWDKTSPQLIECVKSFALTSAH